MFGWRLEVSKLTLPMHLEPCQDGTQRGWGCVAAVGLKRLCKVEKKLPSLGAGGWGVGWLGPQGGGRGVES